MEAGDQVDTRGHHGRGVDESGDGCRALHGIGQPRVQRELRALGEGADGQQRADPGDERPAVAERRAGLAEDGREVE